MSAMGRILTLFSVSVNVVKRSLSCLINDWCPARQISPSVLTNKCKTYCSLFDVSLFDLISISVDGPNNSISQSFRAAINLCTTYAPYTQEAESGLQDLCDRVGIF